MEGRLNTGLFYKLKEGNIIEWMNNNQKFKVIISYIKKYESFYEMLEMEEISNVLPVYYVASVENGVKIYRKYYNELKEQQFGVVAIGMVRIK